MVRRAGKWSFLGLVLVFASVCFADITPGTFSFNTGEISPLMEARADFPKYGQACLTLQNMVVLAQGPAMRRPGTKYIAATKNNGIARLVPFEYSTTDAYILEFGDLYMRVYRNGGQVLDTNDDPYERITPFDDSEVFEIQYAQDADTIYIVHPNEPPQILTRSAHTTWTMDDFDIQNGPFLPENKDTDSNITPSATTGSITLNSSEDIFQSTHIGALWQIRHPRSQTTLNGVLDANESSAVLACEGDYDLNVQGTWVGTVKLERSLDSGGTWNAVYPRANNNVAINEDFSETEVDAGATFRVTMTAYVSGSVTYNFSIHDYMHTGYVRITDVNDSNTVVATVLSTLGSTSATSKWSEGAWSDYRGWPRTVEFHERRICFAGSMSYPQTVWVGATNTTEDYNDFREGTLDDDAFTYILPGQNPIQWILSQTYLMMGTLGGAGRLGREDEPFTPSTPSYRSQSRSGSAYIQALVANDAILYVERGGKKIREFVYSLERDRFVAPDLNVLASHITGDGIVNIAFQSRPDPVLWCVTSGGNLAAMSYLREQEVVAWSEHITDGSFESIATIPGTGEDELWVIVRRTINDNTARYVEQFQPREWASQQHCWFVDSGLDFDGGSTVNITNITKGTPAVVTVSVWPTDGNGGDDANLANGDQIRISNVAGMTQLNNNIYTISSANISAKTFALHDSANIGDITSVGYTTYISGGMVQRVENTFSGLSYLEDKTITVYADSGPVGTATVTNGQIALTTGWYNHVVAGLPYTSILETVPIVFEMPTGTTMGASIQIEQLAINFLDTMGCSYGADSSDIQAISFADSVETQYPLYTGIRDLPFVHGYSERASVYLTTSEPVPLTVRAIKPTVRVVK